MKIQSVISGCHRGPCIICPGGSLRDHFQLQLKVIGQNIAVNHLISELMLIWKNHLRSMRATARKSMWIPWDRGLLASGIKSDPKISKMTQLRIPVEPQFCNNVCWRPLIKTGKYMWKRIASNCSQTLIACLTLSNWLLAT